MKRLDTTSVAEYSYLSRVMTVSEVAKRSEQRKWCVKIRKPHLSEYSTQKRPLAGRSGSPVRSAQSSLSPAEPGAGGNSRTARNTKFRLEKETATESASCSKSLRAQSATMWLGRAGYHYPQIARKIKRARHVLTRPAKRRLAARCGKSVRRSATKSSGNTLRAQKRLEGQGRREAIRSRGTATRRDCLP